jgi:hypothetical protein
MKKSKFTEEQIAFALRQAESGTRVAEVCRKMGIAEQTFFRWKKKYGGLGVSELRRLRQLEDGCLIDRFLRVLNDGDIALFDNRTFPFGLGGAPL